MSVNLDQNRGAVGAFNSRLHSKNIYINIYIRMLDVLPIASAFLSIFLTFIMFILFSKSFCFTILLRKNVKIMNMLLRIFHMYAFATYVFHIWLYLILTKRSGDIEQNPRPKSNSLQSFSICHWNLNSISAHNFIKISLLKTYIVTYKLDVICLSETYLDSSISNDDDNLEIPGYDLLLNEAVFVFIIETLFP